MQKKSKIITWIFVVFFTTLLVLPGLNASLGIWEYERKDENRTFQDTLVIDFTYLDKFPGDFESYYRDNFSFRTPLLDNYHRMQFYWFNKSPHPDQTIKGTNDWYFLAKDEKDIFEGKQNLTSEQLKQFLNVWKYRTNYLDSLGIPSLFIVAPIKHHVYSEYLPINVSQHNKTRRIVQLQEYFKDSLPGLVIDPVPALIEAKEEREVYYRLDNHWNYFGGSVAAEFLLSKIREKLPDVEIDDLPEVSWIDSTIYRGIHYRVIGIEDLHEDEVYPNREFDKSVKAKKYGFPPFPGFAYQSEHERRYVNAGMKEGVKLLMISDSFGLQMRWHLKESFKESVFIFDAWHYGLNKAVIEEYKPDIVVFMIFDSHLMNNLKYK